MSAATMTSQSDITTLTLPTAGVGGSYYDMAFEVPVYPNAPINMVTWRGLDTWNNLTTKYTATQGIGIGLVWATMTYLLALTPNQKRKTAFHSFLLLGLAFLLIHMLIDLVSTLTPGIQTSSAYTVLTLDVGDSVWTRRFVATFSASQVTAWFAFGFAAICLFIQSRGLMTGLKVRRPRLCRLVLGFLALSSVATLGTAMAFSIYEMTTIRDQVQDLERSFDILWAFHWAYSLSYTICIGSYSLVSMISIVDIVWKRPAAISGGSVYASALNLVGLLCAQSFVVPFVFCVLQIVPNQVVILKPEVILLASVYMILPLGSLFMTVNTAPGASRETVETPQAPILGPINHDSPTRDHYAGSEMTLTNRLGLSASQPASYVLDGAHIDRELGSIDEMECGEIVRPGKQTFTDTAAILRDKDSQEKEVVAAWRVAP